MLPNQIRRLVKHPGLNFRHLALIVRVPNIKVSVGNHVERPLARRLKLDIESTDGAGLDSQMRTGGAGPLRDCKVDFLLAKIGRGRKLCRLMLGNTPLFPEA